MLVIIMLVLCCISPAMSDKTSHKGMQTPCMVESLNSTLLCLCHPQLVLHNQNCALLAQLDRGSHNHTQPLLELELLQALICNLVVE